MYVYHNFIRVKVYCLQNLHEPDMRAELDVAAYSQDSHGDPPQSQRLRKLCSSPPYTTFHKTPAMAPNGVNGVSHDDEDDIDYTDIEEKSVPLLPPVQNSQRS